MSVGYVPKLKDMARPSTGLDLTEFFNNDDSQGHRLVEFLQKRRGAVQRRKFLYMNCEPQRLSLNVHLEKLSNSKEAESKQLQKNADTTEDTENLHNSVERHIHNLHHNPDEIISDTNEGLISGAPVSSTTKPPVSPVFGAQKSSGLNAPNLVSSNPSALVSQRPISPKFSVIRKSVEYASSRDRLRRYSLTRRTKLSGGRRTLLKEFESTISETGFDPAICSTPLSQPENNVLIPTPNSVKPPDAQVLQQKQTDIDPSKSDKRDNHMDVLVGTLVRNNGVLLSHIENISDMTLNQLQSRGQENEKPADVVVCDPAANAIPLEKGNNRSKVLLTLQKCAIEQNSETFNILTRHNQTLISENQDSFRVSKMLDANKQAENLSPNRVTNKRNTPQRNLSISLSSQNIDVPERQSLPDVMSSSIVIQSDRDPRMLVIPVNQTFIGSCSKKDHSRVAKVTGRAEIISSISLPKEAYQMALENNEVQLYAEDNVELNDILTEDEDDVLKDTRPKLPDKSILAPIDLATNSNNIPKRRSRKGSYLHGLHKDYSQKVASEAEPSPKAHCNKNLVKKKFAPLNKPPGMALNGENFAEELARMSNNEILDLRKRISLGNTFAISGRKNRSSLEKAIKRIEKELLTRDIGGKVEQQEEQNDSNQYLLVPEEFRDLPPESESTKMQYMRENLFNNVSFKNKKCKSLNENKKQLPEVLEKYLKVTKAFSKKKMQRTPNIKKRSLYTQGNSVSKEFYNSDVERLSSRISQSSKLDLCTNTNPNTVAPPSPLNENVLQSTSQDYSRIVINEKDENSSKTAESNQDKNYNITANIVDLPLPPLVKSFGNKSVVDSNECDNLTTIRNKYQTAKTFSSSSNSSVEDNFDNHNLDIFKKPDNPTRKTSGRKQNVEKFASNPDNQEQHIFNVPQIPVSKRTGRERNKDKNASNDINQTTNNSQNSHDSSTDTNGCAVRRSKRVPVPRNNSMLRSLYQQLINKRLQCIEKKKQKIRNKNEKPRILTNDNPNITRLHQVSKKGKEAKRKAARSVHREKKTNKENFECNDLALSAPSSADQLNNVFNELRNNTSSTSNTTTQKATSTLKVKSFKIRVARMKNLEQHKDFDSVSTTSSIKSSNSTDYQLVSWLKNVKESGIAFPNSKEIFNEMRISAASSLSFTEVQGIEYAFYDTDDKASLGYLRFRPHQVKPKKRAKRYNLHFVALVGNFIIRVNENECRISVGDMIAIEKSFYYDIKNISDDIGILMVIKK